MNTNYLSSDLSNEKFRYDLVVGTTAKAINKTLKAYLAKSGPPTKTLWYGQTEAGGEVSPMTPLEGIDPFSITDKNNVPQQLLDSDFKFAIKAGFSLPAGASLSSMPDILVLGTDKQKVQYNLFFNSFQICTLDWGRKGSYSWNNYQQPNDKPYIFTFQVDMNFDPADPNDQFSNLPADVRAQLLNYNTDTMFSIQQLYLDLNNAGLQSMPSISGIPSTSHVYLILQRDFIDTYWMSLKTGSKFILGYAVHTNSQPVSRTSMQPTSLNFMTVPHYNDDGSISEDRSLYTLNYLMDTNNRPLTVGGPFSWNWITSAEANDHHGAMAVRREVFANFLMDSIAPYLQYIAITGTPHIKLENLGLTSKSSFKLEQTPNQHFNYEPSGGSKIASYSFEKKGHDASKDGAISGHFDINASASSSISISGNEITINIAANLDVDFSNGDIGGAGDVSGRAGGYANTIIFEVAVSPAGRVTVSDKADYPQPKVIAPDLSKGVLAGLDGSISLTDKLSGIYALMTVFMNSFASHVERYLNSTGGKWIFPGGQTFLFKDAAFSEHQDFVTHISYSDDGMPIPIPDDDDDDNEPNVYTVCFSGTACTRDEGEETRPESDKRIYCPETGYIPVRIHKEISRILKETTRSVIVRGAGENDWAKPRNSSDVLLLDAPLKAPEELIKYCRGYSGGDQLSTADQIDGWPATALALHGANLAAASGAQQYNFIGHSRGAAECIMAAWFLYAYGKPDVPINIFAIDPVPGVGEWYGILTQLPPNVVNFVGIYAWDQCVQPGDKPYSALVPRPNGQMTGKLKKGELGGKLGSTWKTLADDCQLTDPLAPAKLAQPGGFELYACRGRHSTVSGNTTADGQYDPNNLSESVAAVPKLIYKMARAYLTKWDTTFRTKSAVPESVLQLRRELNTDHARFDAMGGGETRTSMLPARPYVRRISSISGRNPFDTYYMDDVVGDPPYKLAYPVTNERENAGWVNWKFL